MRGDRNKILVDSIRRLLRRNATSNLRKIISKTHGADLSVVFRSLSLEAQHRIFELIEDPEHKGIVLNELDEYGLNDLTQGMAIEELIGILDHMQSDDVADLIGRLPEERADAILKKMAAKESEEVEDLLRYGDDTAGIADQQVEFRIRLELQGVSGTQDVLP